MVYKASLHLEVTGGHLEVSWRSLEVTWRMAKVYNQLKTVKQVKLLGLIPHMTYLQHLYIKRSLEVTWRFWRSPGGWLRSITSLEQSNKSNYCV